MTDDQPVAVQPTPQEGPPPTVEPITDAVRVDEHTPQFSTSPTIGKLAQALARVQKKVKQPRKAADNPFFKSKYADLHEVWASVAGLLADEGVAVIQTPAFTTAELKGKIIGIITVSTTVIHGESGEWMTNVLRGTSENIGPQAIGSAISYFRRYGLQPMLMLTPDDGSDDDAERAEGRSHAAGDKAEDKPAVEDIEKTTAKIKDAKTLAELKTAYDAIPEGHRRFFNKLVGARKAALEKKEPPAAADPQEPPPSSATEQGVSEA